MRDSERERIFGEWLAGHKGILFKVVHAYDFEHADRRISFRRSCSRSRFAACAPPNTGVPHADG